MADFSREFATEAITVRRRICESDGHIAEDSRRSPCRGPHPQPARDGGHPDRGIRRRGRDLTRFATAGPLASAAGLAPVLQQSGKMHYLRCATDGSKTLKFVFCQSVSVLVISPASTLKTTRSFFPGEIDGVASSALVGLLAEFGVTEQNARAALSRLSRRGLLRSEREGRSSKYRLTAAAAATLAEGTQRIFTFGTHDTPWDGTWTCVSFSVPESRRNTRNALRTRLRWLGFAPLYDAAWFAPGAREEGAAALLAELRIDTASVITGPVRGANPVQAWDLGELRRRYREFISTFEPAMKHAGSVARGEALRIRTAVIDTWRAFPGLDPELPAALLPDSWPRAKALTVFQTVYDALGPAATTRARRIVAVHDPVAASLIDHHTSAQVGAERPGVRDHCPSNSARRPLRGATGRR